MNKKISTPFIIFLVFSFTVTILPSFGESNKNSEELGMLSAEEFAEILDKFTRDADYIEEHVKFEITDHEFYRVYGGLAKGDPEEAIKIFNHPDYPYNVYDYAKMSIEGMDSVRQRQPPLEYHLKFNQLFVNEIIDYRVDSQHDRGIIVIVNEKYANQENFDRYEKILIDEGPVFDNVNIRFKAESTTYNAFNSVIPVMFFVVATSMMIVFLVKKNKI